MLVGYPDDRVSRTTTLDVTIQQNEMYPMIPSETFALPDVSHLVLEGCEGFRMTKLWLSDCEHYFTGFIFWFEVETQQNKNMPLLF